MNPIKILYHRNCPDGFSAAWSAWKKFGNKAKYIPISPRTLPKEKLEDSYIYVLDNSFSIEVQEMLRKNNKDVITIDHHESSKESIEAFKENIFDINHSGAVLAWNYFHPKKKIPLFLKYIEDFDLWKFNLSNTHKINSYINTQRFDFKVWNKIMRDIESSKTRRNITKMGTYILKYEEKIIDEMAKKAYKVKFLGYETLAVNSSFGEINSELGHKLCAKLPPIALVWKIVGNEITVSLRSDGTIDVSKLAKKYGGGGHKGASGFTIPFENKFPWKVL